MYVQCIVWRRHLLQRAHQLVFLLHRQLVCVRRAVEGLRLQLEHRWYINDLRLVLVSVKTWLTDVSVYGAISFFL